MESGRGEKDKQDKGGQGCRKEGGRDVEGRNLQEYLEWSYALKAGSGRNAKGKEGDETGTLVPFVSPSRRCPGLEVPKCHLKTRRRQIWVAGFHGTRRRHAFGHPQKRKGRCGQYRHHAGFRGYAQGWGGRLGEVDGRRRLGQVKNVPYRREGRGGKAHLRGKRLGDAWGGKWFCNYGKAGVFFDFGHGGRP